jgi:hypothetical protein
MAMPVNTVNSSGKIKTVKSLVFVGWQVKLEPTIIREAYTIIKNMNLGQQSFSLIDEFCVIKRTL